MNSYKTYVIIGIRRFIADDLQRRVFMKISTKGRYALRMLIDLASHHDEVFVSLKDIAERQDISKKYLEQIVPMLNKDGILRTNRGNRGGYQLAKKPSEISVGTILRSTEGNLAPVTCLEFEPNECPRKEECATLYIWEGLYKVVNEYLDGITLQDIIDRSINLSGGDYCI